MSDADPAAYGPRGRRSPLRVGVLASGRGSNLQAILDAAAAGRLPAEVVCVVSDKPAAEALARARRHGVDAVSFPAERYSDRERYDDAVLDALERRSVELVALAGYMRRVRPRVLRRYRWRMMNIHPSLLPAFPGLAAPRQALEHGVKVSGCTVHFVDEGIDSGPIIAQAAVPVEETDTVASLSERILKEEHTIYPEAIRLFAEGRLRVEGRRVVIRPSDVSRGDD